jgi:hypothetical protein
MRQITEETEEDQDVLNLSQEELLDVLKGEHETPGKDIPFPTKQEEMDTFRLELRRERIRKDEMGDDTVQLMNQMESSTGQFYSEV